MLLGEARVPGLELLLELMEGAEPELGRPVEIAAPLGVGHRRPRGVDLLRDLPDPPDGVLLALPARLEGGGPLLQVGELAIQALEALPRRLVGLLGERHALDLELHDAALDLVELGRHRVDLDPEPRGGLVDQIDGLVGQEPVGDVPVGEHPRRHQRRVLDPDLVVDLVLVLEPAEDGDGVLDGGLLDEDGLEPPLEGRVLLDVLPVLVEGGGADAAKLPAREGRLQHVRGVHRALGAAGADQRVELVDEADDLAVRLGDLAEHGLQAVLELAAVLRPGDEGAQVERHEALALQALGDVPRHDALGQPLDDGRLADARLADEDGIVLRPSREHLHDPAHLVVPADHGIELALLRELRQVAAVALERLVLRLRVLVGDALGAPDVDERPVERVLRDARLPEDAARGAVAVLGDPDQEMLGRAIVVLEPLHLLPGRVEDGLEAGSHVLPARARDLRKASDRRQHVPLDRLRAGAELRQEGADHAVLLLDEREQEVLGLELLVAFAIGEPLGALNRLLGLDRELVEAKRRHAPSLALTDDPAPRWGGITRSLAGARALSKSRPPVDAHTGGGPERSGPARQAGSRGGAGRRLRSFSNRARSSAVRSRGATMRTRTSWSPRPPPFTCGRP